MVSLDWSFNLGKHVLAQLQREGSTERQTFGAKRQVSAAERGKPKIMISPVLMVMRSISCLAGGSWQQETYSKKWVLFRLRLVLRYWEVHSKTVRNKYVCSLVACWSFGLLSTCSQHCQRSIQFAPSNKPERLHGVWQCACAANSQPMLLCLSTCSSSSSFHSHGNVSALNPSLESTDSK